MVTTNRSAGKTTHYLKRSLQFFKETGVQTALLYRHQYELSSANEIFADILRMYPDLGQEMKTFPHAKGLFYELSLDGQTFGYALALNNIDSLKKYSAVFALVTICIMDEFQLETGNYLKKEVEKLQSLLVTIARGGGSQSREIEVFLLGNDVSMLNPYFIFFDVNRRFKQGTKYIRGHGWIAEFICNESAADAIKGNSLFRAFNSTYMQYSTGQTKLYNDTEFIENLSGNSKYLFTIKHDGICYGVREELKTCIIYVNEKADNNCKNILVFTTGQHATNTVMLSKNSYTAKCLKESFEMGLLRFGSMKSKNAIFDILALDYRK